MIDVNVNSRECEHSLTSQAQKNPEHRLWASLGLWSESRQQDPELLGLEGFLCACAQVLDCEPLTTRPDAADGVKLDRLT
jgi:hypothetical protein